MNYPLIKSVHVTCAALSIALFASRGAMQFAGVPWRQWRVLRWLPHLVDTVLLGAAITLACLSAQYPIAQAWLTAKVLALGVYIVLGRAALAPGTTAPRRALAMSGALLSVAYIVGVAVTRSPWLGH